MATSRTQRTVAALAAHLQAILATFGDVKIHRQWAAPEAKLKGNVPSGCVTALGSRRELDGAEAFGEDGEGRTLTRLGSQLITLQVDIWATSIDQRFEIQAAIEEVFDRSDGNDESDDSEGADPGTLSLTLSDGAGATFTMGDERFEDSAETAADREWRYSFDCEGDVDIVVAEHLPTMNLAIRVRTEDDRRKTPEQIPAGINVFGVELTRTTFRPEPDPTT